MNWEEKLADFEVRLKEWDAKFNNLMIAYNESRDFTQDFLECCKKHDIDLVAINCNDDRLKDNHYSFAPYESVFADGDDNEGWPLIWSVVEDFGISGGCGNSGQHAITEDASVKLIDGVYELKNGQWRKIK